MKLHPSLKYAVNHFSNAKFKRLEKLAHAVDVELFSFDRRKRMEEFVGFLNSETDKMLLREIASIHPPSKWIGKCEMGAWKSFTGKA